MVLGMIGVYDTAKVDYKQPINYTNDTTHKALRPNSSNTGEIKAQMPCVPTLKTEAAAEGRHFLT
jgi:hypothetical protein